MARASDPQGFVPGAPNDIAKAEAGQENVRQVNGNASPPLAKPGPAAVRRDERRPEKPDRFLRAGPGEAFAVCNFFFPRGCLSGEKKCRLALALIMTRPRTGLRP